MTEEIALEQGMQGVLVEYLQLALSRAGTDIMVDGIFGEKTCQAVKLFFQRENCRVNAVDWESLEPFLKGYTIYRIKRGDSLWRIAEQFQTQIGRIIVANPDINPMQLKIGSFLRVPYGFPLVPENVDYSSLLTGYIVEGLLARYPFFESKAIGKSVTGKELRMLMIGSGKKEVFYNAAFHANEWITIPVLLRFAEEYGMAYAEGKRLYGVDAAVLFREFRLYLLPLVNPDGVDLVNGAPLETEYQTGAEQIAADYPQISFPSGWKANIKGVDLNLQFPAGWELAKEIKYAQGYVSPAPRDFVGAEPLEAPESRAVYDFTMRHDLELILAYHTQGETIYWKYRDYEPPRSYEIARYFGEVSGYLVEETPAESGNAGYKDWFIEQYNRPGYTIEAGLGENPLPMSQFPQIYRDNVGILLGGMTELL